MNSVIALPRSGTKYITSVLNTIGIPSVHEQNKKGYVVIDWKNGIRKPKPKDNVVHQVRHPLLVLKSLPTINWRIWDGIIRQGVPDMSNEMMLKSMMFYYHWNEHCERNSSYTYCIENLSPDILKTISNEFDIDITDNLIDKFSTVNVQMNTRHTRKTYNNNINWEMLKSCSVKYYDLIRTQISKYGYED